MFVVREGEGMNLPYLGLVVLTLSSHSTSASRWLSFANGLREDQGVGLTETSAEVNVSRFSEVSLEALRTGNKKR